ncbi:MAG: hypothetical protein JSV91_13155 [Phycisphaerales bacterium]|nr:MAG: hypothetical protein JSV91_13155 [Phycisphaerales bacterium]
MTSAQSMQPDQRKARTAARFGFLLVTVSSLLCSCTQNQLLHPAVLQAPYERPQLWAVAPFANESGVSAVDANRVADLFTEQAQQADRINTVPVNRVLEAMQRLQMPAVQTPGDARTLMNVLDVDGLIVGTVTAYDPYRPPKLGLAVELHARDSEAYARRVDPWELVRSGRGDPAPGELGPANPVAQAAGVFDAHHHDTLMRLRHYARGRDEPQSAYGPDIYLVRMELYTQFVCHQLIGDLLACEQSRINLAAAENQVR